MKSSPIMLLAIALPLVAAPVSSAHAYIDPGTGSLLLQGLIGGIVGTMFVARLYWQKLKIFFAGKGPEDNKKEIHSTTTENE